MFSVRVFSFILFTLFTLPVLSQENALVEGKITGEDGEPLSGATVAVLDSEIGTITDNEGEFTLSVPPGKKTIIISYLGYEPVRKILDLEPKDVSRLNVSLEKGVFNIDVIEITDKGTRNEISMHKIDPQNVKRIPNTTGGIEMVLKTMPGVVSNNELSSQYSVRGGNFDENLVYVNDFEIYRPFLIRSGQQEGFSFANPDLTGNILFSSGGFESKFGDKMSSVLDIQYKQPKDFKGSVALSLLGGSMHLEGTSEDRRVAYLFGIRHKSNQYLLNSLETKGEYSPSFSDIQAYFSYDLTLEWQLELLANYSRNSFSLKPDSLSSTVGVVNQAIRFDVYFEGQEVDKYESAMTGVAANYRPHKNLHLKWLASAYVARESETFDLLGEYFLYEVETDLGKDNFGQRKFALGAGGFHDWARNELTAVIGNLGHKGYYSKNDHYIQWGARVQYENIEDRINEWDRLDSAGYSLPYSDSAVIFSDVLKTTINLNSLRFNGYIQDAWSLNRRLTLTGGVRFNYWDVNKQFLISPRTQLNYEPDWDEDIIFKAAAGFYHQPPFYRELRDLEGNIDKDVKAQEAIHFVLGSDYKFNIWGRPFRFISEVYYKKLNNLIPYEIDNVRIRYWGENRSHGYAAGLDFRLHGEFVEGDESWVSLSVMQTEEDIEGDFYIDSTGNQVPVGFIPRPTDQRLNVGIFFQDHLPQNENFKVHLHLLFGTGLPFGPPENERFRNAFRIPPYRRVDIGFSALLYDRSKKEALPHNPLKHFRSVWTSLEVFNLLQVANTVSYIWIKDVQNTVYAIPNHLTSRRINLKVIVDF